MITDMNNTYMEPSQLVLDTLVEMGYKPIKKNILKKALEKGYLFCVINDTIYYREESELEGFQKVELVNSEDYSPEQLQNIIQMMMDYNNSQLEDEETEEVCEEIVEDEEINLLVVEHEGKETLFVDPGVYCEFLGVRIHPETQEDVIIGFTIEDMNIIPKIWSFEGQNLNGDTHLTPFQTPWYMDETSFPAIVEVKGSYAKAVAYQDDMIICTCCGETFVFEPSEVSLLQTV